MVAEVALLAFATGLTSKFADLLNEHGVRWFRGASAVSGLVWGGLAAALTLTDRWVAVVWAGTVLFWFLRCKLDHFNHAFAGVCVLGAALFMARTQDLSLLAVSGVTLWLAASGVVNTLLKTREAHRRWLQRFLRLRLRYYLGPAVVAVVAHSWLPVVAIAAGMLGTEWVTVWHASLAARGRLVRTRLGITYDPALAGAADAALPVPAPAAATAPARREPVDRQPVAPGGRRGSG